MSDDLIFGLYIFALATFVGYQVISRVPALLHTPLMSGTNAISGISLVGSLVAAGTEDNNSMGRWQIAFGKAYGSLFMGVGSKRLGTMAADRPAFIGALAHLPAGGMIPVAGGVLIRDAATNAVIGAVGVSGDTSDNDEAAASTGIGNAGFKADGG